MLDAKGVSWKYYVPVFPNNGGQMWNAFDAISRGALRQVRMAAQAGTVELHGQLRLMAGDQRAVRRRRFHREPVSGTQPVRDRVALPQVSWVIPGRTRFRSLRRTAGNVDNGPDWVATVVNAIGESSYWNSTAIVVLWDDWGGCYDHVPPPQLDYTGLGFRVPMIIVSPYAKKGYVSHTQYEFGSF